MRFRPGRALILLASALTLTLAARGDGPAVFVGRVVWAEEGRNFGGWSGLEVAADGGRFVAISDRGWITDGEILRSATGRPAGIDPAPMRRLANTPDDFFRYDARDAEGLAIAPDGRVFVAFEAVRRVLTYPDRGGQDPQVLPIFREFIGLSPNLSLEALAIGPDGALYTLPEVILGGVARPVYRFDGRAWSVFGRLPEHGDEFAPVGADFGPDGRFYLLERRLVENVGFASRVRRFTLDDGGLGDETVLLVTRPGVHDNLEGLAVWEDARGRMRLTMIADDNFGRYQKTELVEYLVR